MGEIYFNIAGLFAALAVTNTAVIDSCAKGFLSMWDADVLRNLFFYGSVSYLVYFECEF